MQCERPHAHANLVGEEREFKVDHIEIQKEAKGTTWCHETVRASSTSTKKSSEGTKSVDEAVMNVGNVSATQRSQFKVRCWDTLSPLFSQPE